MSTAFGTVGGVLAAFSVSWQASELIGWDIAGAIFLLWTWLGVAPLDAAATQRVALAEDPSVPLADLLMISAGVACIVGAGFALSKASSASSGTKAYLIALAVTSVLVSWASVHTIYMLRYARLYYSGAVGGVDFNEKDPPAYLDFAYLALCVGMTFQVSDTNLQSKPIRRAALRHALLSWLFGAVIIGLTINILASLLH